MEQPQQRAAKQNAYRVRILVKEPQALRCFNLRVEADDKDAAVAKVKAKHPTAHVSKVKCVYWSTKKKA